MKYTFSNDINNYYLHITDPDNSMEGDFRVKMLLHNDLPGFVPLNITYTDNQPEYTYNITGLSTINDVCSLRKLSLNEFMSLLISLDDLLSLADKYLLNPDNFIFISDYIFINPESYKLSICYCPFHDVGFRDSFYEFICFLLNHINYDDKNLVDKVYKLQKDCIKSQMPIKLIIGKIIEENDNLCESSTPCADEKEAISLDETPHTPLKPCKINKNLMNDVTKKKLTFNLIFPYIKLTVGSILVYFILIFLQIKFNLLSLTMLLLLIPIIIGIICYSIFKIVKLRERYYEVPILSELLEKNTKDNNASANQSNDDINADVTEDFNNNLICEALSNDIKSKLVPEDKVHFDIINLNKNPFTIGKISGNTDGYIFSPLVSRVHARITCDDEKYFIKDLNSAEGTFLNEEKLQPDTLYPLKSGDKISFSTIKYTFLCI